MRTYRRLGVAALVACACVLTMGCASKVSSAPTFDGGPEDPPDYAIEPIWMSTPDFVTEGQATSITVGFSHNGSTLFPMVSDPGCSYVCHSFVPSTLGPGPVLASPVLAVPMGSGQSNAVTFGVTPPLATADYLYRVTVYRTSNPSNKISKSFFVKATP